MKFDVVEILKFEPKHDSKEVSATDFSLEKHEICKMIAYHCARNA